MIRRLISRAVFGLGLLGLSLGPFVTPVLAQEECIPRYVCIYNSAGTLLGCGWILVCI